MRDWGDLVRPGVSVVTANPKTSGGARWGYLAAYGWALRQPGGSDAKAREYIARLLRQVPVLDSGARGATVTFADRGIGDVLLAWENEAHLALKEFGSDKFEIVYPPTSILAEPPVAVVDKVVDKRGTRKVAEAYLEYLYSPVGQEIAAKNFYRPIDDNVAAKYAAQFPKIALFTIDEVFGGWVKAQKTHFADGGGLRLAQYDDVASSGGVANEQRAAAAVGRRVDDEQRPGDAVVGEASDRQRLLRFDDDLADLVDADLVRVVRRERRDVELAVDGGDASEQPAVAVAQPVFAADHRRLVVEPGEGGAKACRGRDAAGRGEPVAARDVELAVEDDSRRAAGVDARDASAGTVKLADARGLAARKHLQRIADGGPVGRATCSHSTRGRWPALPLPASAATYCTGSSAAPSAASSSSGSCSASAPARVGPSYCAAPSGLGRLTLSPCSAEIGHRFPAGAKPASAAKSTERGANAGERGAWRRRWRRAC